MINNLKDIATTAGRLVYLMALTVAMLVLQVVRAVVLVVKTLAIAVYRVVKALLKATWVTLVTMVKVPWWILLGSFWTGIRVVRTVRFMRRHTQRELAELVLQVSLMNIRYAAYQVTSVVQSRIISRLA